MCLSHNSCVILGSVHTTTENKATVLFHFLAWSKRIFCQNQLTFIIFDDFLSFSRRRSRMMFKFIHPLMYNEEFSFLEMFCAFMTSKIEKAGFLMKDWGAIEIWMKIFWFCFKGLDLRCSTLVLLVWKRNFCKGTLTRALVWSCLNLRASVRI